MSVDSIPEPMLEEAIPNQLRLIAPEHLLSP